MNIKEIELSKKFDAFFMVKACQIRQTASGSNYMDLVLVDKTGEINGKIWDLTDEIIKTVKEGSLVKVRATAGKWQEQMQLKIESIRQAKDEDGIDITEFIPSAPEDPEEMFGFVLKIAEGIKDKDLKAIALHILKENKKRMLIFPAALKNHHSVRGGLLQHICTMLKAGEKLAQVYTYINCDLLFAGIILHDIAKLDEIEVNEYGIALDYTTQGMLLGHITQGILVIEKAAEVVKADKEKALLLKHMIISHHSEPEYGSPRRPMFPEAEMLHYLDILDARLYDMNKAKLSVKNKEFSDKVWTLDNRKVYNIEI